MQRLHPLYAATIAAVVSIVAFGVYQLGRSGLPSADVVAISLAANPVIQIADFEPGEVRIVKLNGLPIIVWRRDAADKRLAAAQNTPADWVHKHSTIYGHANQVFADDANLTLDGTWFFALAKSQYSRYAHYLPRAGRFDALREGHYGTDYDMAGRLRAGYHGGGNMTIIKAEFTEDQTAIRLDLSGRPTPATTNLK